MAFPGYQASSNWQPGSWYEGGDHFVGQSGPYNLSNGNQAFQIERSEIYYPLMDNVWARDVLDQQAVLGKHWWAYLAQTALAKALV